MTVDKPVFRDKNAHDLLQEARETNMLIGEMKDHNIDHDLIYEKKS
jgi:hypothetical protein